jgi:hypothetical protein
VELGVYVLHKDLAKAKTEVDGVMEKLIALAADLGIAPDQLEASPLNLYPSYSEEEVAAFLGYEVTRSLTVQLKDLSRLEPLLTAAVNAGANRNFNVRLTSSRRDELKREARRLAIEDAEAQAAAAAEQLGVTLTSVRSINLDPSSRVVTSSIGATYSWEGRFLLGDVTEKATVQIVFLLDESGRDASEGK